MNSRAGTQDRSPTLNHCPSTPTYIQDPFLKAERGRGVSGVEEELRAAVPGLPAVAAPDQQIQALELRALAKEEGRTGQQVQGRPGVQPRREQAQFRTHQKVKIGSGLGK
jgi:hypothetical protein